MKNVVILHGTGETPEYMWLPWVKGKLEEKGYAVSIPSLPDTDNPLLASWLPVALRETFTPETILLGHSAGACLELSVLENITIKIKQAILVAGYARRKGEEKEADKMVQKSYDWKKIAQHVDDLIFINSDNDPWGCNDVEGRYMLDNIGKGKLIIPKGEAHMGSVRFNQPYNEFPFLLKLID